MATGARGGIRGVREIQELISTGEHYAISPELLEAATER
jgi:hypothetical protein